jgi:hypothetical protein
MAARYARLKIGIAALTAAALVAGTGVLAAESPAQGRALGAPATGSPAEGLSPAPATRTPTPAHTARRSRGS